MVGRDYALGYPGQAAVPCVACFFHWMFCPELVIVCPATDSLAAPRIPCGSAVSGDFGKLCFGGLAAHPIATL